MTDLILTRPLEILFWGLLIVVIIGLYFLCWRNIHSSLFTVHSWRIKRKRNNKYQPNGIKDNHGRNPKDWVIKGRNNSNEDWTVLTTVTNDQTMQDINSTDYSFPILNKKSYQYFRFEVSAVRSGRSSS